MPRFAMVLLMVVMPGGLLIVSAWLVARILVDRMREDQGPQGRRLARAVARLSWRDVMAQAKLSRAGRR